MKNPNIKKKLVQNRLDFLSKSIIEILPKIGFRSFPIVSNKKKSNVKKQNLAFQNRVDFLIKSK